MAEAKVKRKTGQSSIGKKYKAALAKVQFGKSYSVAEGFKLLPEVAFAKFDETVDVAFNLGAQASTRDVSSRSIAPRLRKPNTRPSTPRFESSDAAAQSLSISISSAIA